MDTPQLTHVSLCAGYGGIDLGLRRVLPDLRTIAYSEIEEYACGLLAARMESGHLDPAPIWSDLKTFPFSDFHGCVDILSGGYPCQPFSAAGKRRGTDDPRHLWPFIADGIRLCQPRFCFLENVEGHISLGLQDVLGDLADLGYRATWGLFSAAEVGAPHQRKRVFILAHRLGARLEGYTGHVHHQGWQSEGQAGSASTGSVSRMAHASGIVSKRIAGPRTGSSEAPGGRASNQSPGSDGGFWPSRPSEPQHGWEPPRVVGNAEGEQAGGVQLARVSSDAASASDRGSGKILGDPIVYGHLARTFSEGIGASEGEGRLQESARGSGSVGDTERAERRPNDDWITGEADKGSSNASSSGEGVADASSLNSERGSARAGRRSGSEIDAAGGNAEQQRETQPSLGRDIDGPASRMDYANLSIACHNRTDELRLLGNGVVPATAERAFRTLYARLFP